MDSIHLALATATQQVSADELAQVAAALQKQILRDFTPLWDISASVDAMPADAIPPGYWPIIVQDTLDQDDADGYHQRHDDGSPYALVRYGSTWSLTASHECLEMLADPSGMRRYPSRSLIADQGRVDYIVEVCDPCETVAYEVNGVAVSDFYTPHYFDPVATAQTRYSYTGAIHRPRQLCPGGYLSWIANDALLYQAFADEAGRITFSSGRSLDERNGRPLREFVDSLTPGHHRKLSNTVLTAPLSEAHAAAAAATAAHSARFDADITRRFGALRLAQ